MSGRKAQAAMEFMMNYGWAFLVLLAVFTGLYHFGILDKSMITPERTVFAGPVPSTDNALVEISGNTITIPFKNNKGETITFSTTDAIASGDCEGDITFTANRKDGTLILPGDVIRNGELFLVTFICDDFSGKTVNDALKTDIQFEYTSTNTGLSRPLTGNVIANIN